MFDSIQFSSIGEFFSMGGYAFNVWTVYTLFVLFFAINLYFPLIRKKQILSEQKRRLIVNREMQTLKNDDGENS
ncbi:MAG: heme exporter protein CcmD [Proteobacteria bacterium]|nr:heme exporter protein CcmD [Pseudomonadota bacterium]